MGVQQVQNTEKSKTNQIPSFKHQNKQILTPYYLFLEEMRFKAVRDTPELPRHQIAKNAFQKFHLEMSQEEKQVYIDRSKQITTEAEAQQYLKTLEESYIQNNKVQKKKIRKQTQQKKQKK